MSMRQAETEVTDDEGYGRAVQWLLYILDACNGGGRGRVMLVVSVMNTWKGEG